MADMIETHTDGSWAVWDDSGVLTNPTSREEAVQIVDRLLAENVTATAYAEDEESGETYEP